MDIIITYILFGVGLGLEIVGAVLLIISDWTIVSLNRSRRCLCFASAIIRMVRQVLRDGKPRWSNTIGQYNLVSFCLRDRDTITAWIMRKISLKEKWDHFLETRLVMLPYLLEDMMFTEVKRRALNVHIYNVLVKARSYRGSKALERHGQLKTLEWSMKKEFDECIILWHVATDICFHADKSNQLSQDDPISVVSWKVSNYMVYLLTQQQSMMQLGYGKTRFEATCAVAKKIFKTERKLEEQKARELLLEKTFEGGEDGVSVLVDGCRLAREMLKIDKKIKWQVIGETWMEMLAYASIHCDSYQHAKALSRGGELLTHIWLLMAHMGVVEEHKMQQFQSGSA
jgi:Protein of unknown function, DUF594/Domain of unknown function (DUF4220)